MAAASRRSILAARAMQWYDGNLDLPPDDERYRRDRARFAPQERNDDDRYDYDRGDDLVETEDIDYGYARDADIIAGSIRPAGSGRRRGRSAGGDVGGAIHDDAIVLGLLEEALSKYSANKSRPPSTAVRLKA